MRTSPHPDERPEDSPAAPDAPFGYGRSEYSGPIVHILAEDWRHSRWPGKPDSLWTEHREPEHVMSAWALCGRAVQWKAEPPSASRLMCRICLMPADQRALQHTRLRPVLVSDESLR
ncbi:hypothetical protein [Streptomyces olivoreticuli]|uniref:hypothetical protein n=1 Tax=Streptomyces olivoreticuli TaxID=68246 RepID=UPI0013C32E6C|nr:hypothetical protein [Streptomyces olivoreticuli]